MTNATLAVLTLLAILVAPLLAVQTQKWLERFHEAKNRKMATFKTLMMYRATPISPIYVQALNVIELEFTKRRERKVRDAWKVLLDYLNDPGTPNRVIEGARAAELRADLLVAMGECLGYRLDKVQIKKGVYYPLGLGTMEEEQNKIRELFLEVLQNKRRLPVAVFEQKFPDIVVGAAEEKARN